MRVLRLLVIGCAAAALLGPPVSGAGASSGGTGFDPGPAPQSTPTQTTPAHPVVPGYRARIINGIAYAPSYAPIQVQRAIWAGDAIRHKPYLYGGGHGAWISSGYDCSGSVSYILHAAGLIQISMDSGQMMSWGLSGRGQWMTIYSNPGHAFIQVAGIRLDTSSEQDPRPNRGAGPRWRPVMKNTRGYLARHPVGF